MFELTRNGCHSARSGAGGESRGSACPSLHSNESHSVTERRDALIRRTAHLVTHVRAVMTDCSPSVRIDIRRARVSTKRACRKSQAECCTTVCKIYDSSNEKSLTDVIRDIVDSKNFIWQKLFRVFPKWGLNFTTVAARGRLSLARSGVGFLRLPAAKREAEHLLDLLSFRVTSCSRQVARLVSFCRSDVSYHIKTSSSRSYSATY